MITDKEIKTREEKEMLLISYYGDVFHYLSVFNIKRNFLEDAVQDTFVEAFTNLDKLRDVEKMKPWLLKIAKRVGTKYVIKNKNITIKECSFEEYVVQSKSKTGTHGDMQIESLVIDLDNRELYDYIEKLSEREQRILILYYVYGHTLKDIAEITGEKFANVRSVSRRAKLKLKVMLEEGGFRNE